MIEINKTNNNIENTPSDKATTNVPEGTNTPESDPSVTTDPFDEELGEQLILTETSLAEAHSYTKVDGMAYIPVTLPYIAYKEQTDLKRKLKEVYQVLEFLLIYGYSGTGKSTVLMQFQEHYPVFIFYQSDFADLSFAAMLAWMGKCIDLPLRQRTSEIFLLEEALRSRKGIMFLFDEVTAERPADRKKIDALRKIHMASGVPIVLCGTSRLFNALYDPRFADENEASIARMDIFHMEGMPREAAARFLEVIEEKESVAFTYPARQALINIALNNKMGALHALTAVISRSITIGRVHYYHQSGRNIPDNTACIRPIVPAGVEYPGGDIQLTPPVTPEPILIDEYLVKNTLYDYKSNFETKPVTGKRRPRKNN